MLEYEKKIMLTADEYLSILMLMCKYVPMQTQTNYYFDDDEFSMNEKGITCRIRGKNGKFKATIKNHNVESPDCSVEVDLVEKTEFESQIFNVLGLHHQGELITDRVVIHKDPVCEMVLDRNVYLGHTDFELEVEYSKESEQEAQKLIESIGDYLVSTGQLTGIDAFINRIGQAKPKSQRFFDKLKKVK